MDSDYRLANSVSQSQPSAADDDPGYRAGWFRPEFNDSAWRPISQPACDGLYDENAHVWTRTRIALPADAKNKPLTLTLGGFSIFDYRYLRAFLNGHEIGVRNAPGRWREPLAIDLGPASKSRDYVAYGGENLIALQLSGCVTRLPRLEELNPSRSRTRRCGRFGPANSSSISGSAQPSSPRGWKLSPRASRKQPAAAKPASS